MRLTAHLDCDPELVCVGEAPGYAGCRFSGVAFTSERLLLAGRVPRIQVSHRLSTRRLPFSEPSATVVWRTLEQLGCAQRTVLWNTVQLHPQGPGHVLTNRAPTPKECALGAPALHILRDAFPRALWVAVGRKAQAALSGLGVDAIAVRHPSMGGASEFATGLAEALRSHRSPRIPKSNKPTNT